MINKYKCERCFYETNLYGNNIKHINKKKRCSKHIESYQYSDDQLFILSILPRYINIDNNELKKHELSSLFYENRNDIFDIFNDICLA